MSAIAWTRGRAPRHIALEGPIGVGKTTLARRMATSIGAGLMLEQPEDNPFLERFYRSPSQYALQTQLYFLFQRVKQLASLRQGDLFSPVHIADFMLEKDPLFARLTLDEDELYLYEQVYKQLAPEVPAPDLVIYLQSTVDALLRRISRRGRPYELMIDRNYLEQVTEAYSRFFHSYDEGPLLIVNASQIDPIQNDADYEQLFKQIENTTGGRHFFNPVSAALA